MTITLIGYRGCGKTTVGAQLATQLEYDFVDSDVVIEQRGGKTIARMFAEDGEPHFRALEASVIANLLQQDNLVLAVGGGAILNPASRAAMRQTGPVIWLQASPEALLQRILGDATTADRRPSLTNQDQRTEVENVLKQRWPIYEESATHIVNTEGRSVDAIVDEIATMLNAGS